MPVISRQSHPLVRSGPKAPHPSDTKQYPWRFRVGDDVYVWKQRDEFSLRVVGGELYYGCPHLFLQDHEDQLWRVPQIQVTSKNHLHPR